MMLWGLFWAAFLVYGIYRLPVVLQQTKEDIEKSDEFK